MNLLKNKTVQWFKYLIFLQDSKRILLKEKSNSSHLTNRQYNSSSKNQNQIPNGRLKNNCKMILS